MTTRDDILQHRSAGAWRTLERRAQVLVESAREHGGESFAPVLGGGTRLMLALNHRISDDIDLFVDSPGWLPYISPRLNDQFESELSSYHEDSAHVKLIFDEGEIDFIAAANLLDAKDVQWNPPAAETAFALEAPAEVLAKKLFFRGWALTPRDLFDWIAVEKAAPPGAIPHQALAKLLASKLGLINQALEWLGRRATSSQAWTQIQAPAVPDLGASVDWAIQQLDHLRTLAGR